MVTLIVQIEGNCFYVILSTLPVWRRSDLFSVSLKITEYISLHNQTPLHMTLSKLVFTSYCTYFCCIMICPVSSAYTIGVVSIHWTLLWTGYCSGYFFFIFFSISVFFHGHWQLTRQQGKGGDHLLFHSTTSTRSRTFRHLFATLHVRWHHIFLIAPLVFTRLLLDEIYHLIELPFDWLMWH